MKMIVRLALMFLLVSSSPLLAQSPLVDARIRVVSAERFLHGEKSARSATLSTASRRMLVVDAAVATSLLAVGGDLVVTDFPIGQVENGDVVLARLRPIIDAKTEVWIGTEHGDIPGRIPNVVSYRGTIRGERGSRVFMSLIDGEIYGIVRRADGSSWILSPASSGAKGAHLLVPESMFHLPPMARALRCGADRTPNYFRSGKLPFKASVLSSELLEVAIAVEADNSFLQRAGGTVEKATAYIAALFGMVSSMYEDEVDVVFHLPWIKVWTAPDPYQVAGNGYTLFEKAPVYWRANYQNVDRDMAHILTGSEWGGGGVGFRGEGIDGGAPVLCSKQYGYSVSSPRGVLGYPTFAFTYDAYIVAHEIGHNFGARHTHDCWWSPALDTCYTKDDAKYSLGDACHSKPITPRASSGSIMSYCAAINYDASGGVFDSSKVELTFTPRVAAVMRQEAELASCLRPPLDPMIILTSPRGETREYPADSTIEITWTSTRVANVVLQYSTDSGRTWLGIVSGLPVAPESYSWRLPRLCSRTVIVRISDAANPAVADTSLLPFAIRNVVRIDAVPRGPFVLCGGIDSLILDAGGGYNEYLWSTGATTRLIVVRQRGIYSVRVGTSNGCSGTATIEVTAASPEAPTITRSNDTLVSSVAGSYQWHLEDAPIPGAITRTWLPLVDGRYTVSVTDRNACPAISSPYLYTKTSGVESNDRSGSGIVAVSVLVESTAGRITIELTLAHPDVIGITLFDNLGRQVAALPKERRARGANVIHWPIPSLPSGSYILVLRAGTGVTTRKLVVRR